VRDNGSAPDDRIEDCHKVAQIFCRLHCCIACLALLDIVFSALPVAYNDHPIEEWTHFATAVLQARAPRPAAVRRDV
jgi:hypothetical protein